MGQDDSKCRCCKSKENNEIKFDEMNENSNSENNNSSKNSKLKKSNLKDLKSYVSFKNCDILSQKEDETSSANNLDKSVDNSSNKKLPKIVFFKSDNDKKEIEDEILLNKSIKNLEKNSKTNKNKKEEKNNSSQIVQNFFGQRSLSTLPENGLAYNTYSIIKIQKIYKGYYYRTKLYPSIKEQLEEILYSKLKQLYNKYLTENLKNQEMSIGINHNEDSYKTLLSNLNSVGISSAFMKELRLFTKLYILKYNNLDAFYVGEVDINNNLNGKGTLTLSDGTRFNGTFEKNKFNGIGKIINNEGTLFEGYFKDGKLDGRATEKMLNGSIYIGDFIKGIKDGKGKEETNEQLYEGDFKNDKKEGYGKVYYKKLKDTYEGEFKNNNITGNGTYKWYDGESYTGSFLNGNMNGKGIYKWPDGKKYEGDYVNNIKEGYGVFTWPKGKVYEGPFKNGKPDGNGILKSKKKKFKVFYKNGKIKGKVVEITKGSSNSKKDFEEEEEDESGVESDNESEENEEEESEEEDKKNMKKNKKKKKEEKDLDSFYLQDQNINKKNKKNKKNINESEEDLRKIDIDRIGSKFDNALKKKKMENSRKKQ